MKTKISKKIHSTKDSRKRVVRKGIFKRRMGHGFTLPIPYRNVVIGQVYALGSNEFSQCGIIGIESCKQMKHIKTLEKYNIVDICSGSLHNAALTEDGKIITWGVNDHGKFTNMLLFVKPSLLSNHASK